MGEQSVVGRLGARASDRPAPVRPVPGQTAPGHTAPSPPAPVVGIGDHLDGLDGIRAFAVLAVIGVHQEFTWLPGGFYGVDAFFVLSGFLITTLLVRELTSSGTIRFGSFWMRRARRLLPAVLVLVVTVAVLSATVPRLIGTASFPGALATLFYSANWYLTFQHADYFAASAAPSPLLHTWSLAIEEQFYLLWPLVLFAVVRLGRRRGAMDTAATRRRLVALFGLATAGALVSAGAMWALTPANSDPSAAYYGTESRLQGILVGAALALGFILWGRPHGRSGRTVATAGAVVGVAVTALMWTRVSELSSFAFHGGFLVASLGAALVIACVAGVPSGAVSRFLGTSPLRRLGVISYGVYLWYWPVTLAITPQRLPVGPYGLFAVRLGTTITLAWISYVLVERPIRYGRTRRRLRIAVLPIGASVALSLTALTLVPAGAATSGVPVPRQAASSGLGQLRVLVTGDSMAGSLAVGLAEVAPRYHLEIVNDGHPGCSMSGVGEEKVLFFTAAPGFPCSNADPDALFRSWQSIVDTFNPDVVVYLARSDLLNQVVDGRWQHVDEPGFDTYLTARYSEGVGVLASRGAAVVLMTNPVYQSSETANDPWPEDQVARVVTDNAILRHVTASYNRGGSPSTGLDARSSATPGGPSHPSVHLFDLGHLVTPGDAFTASRSGAILRCQDGVHFTVEGGAYVARTLLPEIVTLGEAHHRLFTTGSWVGAPPPIVPGWWNRLPCST